METMAIRQGAFGARTGSRRDFIKGSSLMVAAAAMGGVARASKISAGGATPASVRSLLSSITK